MTAPTNEELAERLLKRAKAIRELWDIATHIGPFPLDAMLIDAKLEEAAAARLTENGGGQVAEMSSAQSGDAPTPASPPTPSEAREVVAMLRKNAVSGDISDAQLEYRAAALIERLSKVIECLLMDYDESGDLAQHTLDLARAALKERT